MGEKFFEHRAVGQPPISFAWKSRPFPHPTLEVVGSNGITRLWSQAGCQTLDILSSFPFLSSELQVVEWG